ncbi:sigma-70 family RNA polymerase sigma factor [Salipaludibacillus aurantiacus]|uniref:DNA-directed RNA polymerase n=1 Tax=Salipaludibacillus aurantiacus TaxID=1601833 RepID=A0A1H9UD97_9BACI|nr:sigma-70 family RNA polymerase sigma factor [Salipaludibacillus aurantiacus]SES07540.1 DNA-directed RNA polymerase [Salipaludibacillus aurantiacus]
MEKIEYQKDVEFEEICKQFEPMIYGLIRRWNLGSDKEDYIQTARIALYEAWMRHDGELGAFPAYAKSYVYGRIQQSLEKKERWQTNNVPVEPMQMGETCPGIVFNEEERVILYDWLERTSLTTREKDWVREALFHGHKPQEIADKFGVSVTTVKTWRKTALKKLREKREELF